jgi:hypothetical protein
MADRPALEADEIEVAPKMTEAGAAELARYTTVFDTLEDGANRIFRAMLHAAPPNLKDRLAAK